MSEAHFHFQLLVPIGLILVGGSVIYWLEYFTKMGPQFYMWVLPWSFGMAVAGGYWGWVGSGIDAPIWSRIIGVVVGCVLGLLAGLLGLISDPRTESGPVEQYLSTLALLGMPVGVVVGLHVGEVWGLSGPVIGFCLGPVVFVILLYIISFPWKIFAWIRNRLR